MTDLENTPGGQWLAEQNLFDGVTSPVSAEEARQIWIQVAEQFARETSGDVLAVLDRPKPEGLFLSVQLPILREGLATGRVTRISVRDSAAGTEVVLTRDQPGPGDPAIAIVSGAPTPQEGENSAERGWFGRTEGTKLTLVRPQLADHPDGWWVGNLDRWTVEYTGAGLTAHVDVDRGIKTVIHAASLRRVEADQAPVPLTADERELVWPRVTAAAEVLGMTLAVYVD